MLFQLTLHFDFFIFLEDEKEESTEQGKTSDEGKTETDYNASTLKETLTSKLLKNQDKFDKADKQLVHINEDGSKVMELLRAYFMKNSGCKCSEKH